MQANELYMTYSIPVEDFKDITYEQANIIIEGFRQQGMTKPRKARYAFNTW
jgi:hypothetical protein